MTVAAFPRIARPLVVVGLAGALCVLQPAGLASSGPITGAVAPAARVSPSAVSFESVAVTSVAGDTHPEVTEPASADSTAPTPPPAPADYVEQAWAPGFQKRLNACGGGVALSAAYGVAVIGGRWECGGARFPSAGALVQLTGVISGTYRVGYVVAVLDAYRDSAADIPHGYGLLYQTCRGGSAHTETFAELTRIG